MGAFQRDGGGWLDLFEGNKSADAGLRCKTADPPPSRGQAGSLAGRGVTER